MKKKDAFIIVLCNAVDELRKNAEKYSFRMEKQYGIWQGKEKLDVAKFVR